MSLPALIISDDVLPGGGELNGRRWAGQQLLRCWAHQVGERPMALAHADPARLSGLKPLLEQAGLRGELHGLGLIHPEPVRAWGGLFLPDPSIGRWAQWRQRAGSAAFSLIGQIHTLSTPAALGHLQDLVVEPVQPWDALICSSTAGRGVVEAVLEAREQQLLQRVGAAVGGLHTRRPQLPVIPLPLPADAFQPLQPRRQARSELGLREDQAVLLWLGRLSLFTKLDPWPAYQVLERVARQLEQPLVLIECGPDDQPSQHALWEEWRALCPHVQFLRLGGDQPVPEAVKRQALAATDVAMSLVDNPQETFGLAVAEAMAAGLPLVLSDWNGYRDLVRDGIDGFLVPSRWADCAPEASVALGWQQFCGLQPFPGVAGALAQLVQLDGAAAEAALLTLLRNPAMALGMGKAARLRAETCFAPKVVMAQYEQLFAQLEQRRAAAPAAARQAQPASLQLDLVRAFASYATTPAPDWIEEPALERNVLERLPEPVRRARSQLWGLLQKSLPAHHQDRLPAALIAKHGRAVG